jgi:membrane protease YdiL (CAAX protease family)
MMNTTAPIVLTYGLLAISVVALWLPSVRVAGRATVLPWAVALLSACIAGGITGLVSLSGIASLALFVILAYWAKHSEHKILRVILMVMAGVMTLALSMHKFPGFSNPAIVSNMLLGHGAPPFTHRLNFDTSAAGIILFAFFCTPARTRQDWSKVWKQYPVIFGTAAVVLLLGVAFHYVGFDPKFVAYTPVFLVCNLLFTCVTEEAFFRGFMQHQLAIGLRDRKYGQYIAMTIAAVLFGIAHVKGGPMLIGFASLAGLGYGYAYLRSQRIEASILTHFTLNAAHFVALTYPQLF